MESNFANMVASKLVFLLIANKTDYLGSRCCWHGTCYEMIELGIKGYSNLLVAVLTGGAPLSRIDALVRIVGGDNVLEDPEILDNYSTDMSFAATVRPRCVVKPSSTQVDLYAEAFKDFQK
jgi:hypothetical protein